MPDRGDSSRPRAAPADPRLVRRVPRAMAVALEVVRELERRRAAAAPSPSQRPEPDPPRRDS